MPAYLPTSAVCLLALRVFSVSDFLQFYSCQLANVSAEEPAGVRSLPCFINKIASLFWFSIFIVVDEAKWIRKNTAMYTKYKFGNLILMWGNVISCLSGEICCGSRLTESTDLLRVVSLDPACFIVLVWHLLMAPRLLDEKYRSDLIKNRLISCGVVTPLLQIVNVKPANESYKCISRWNSESIL